MAGMDNQQLLRLPRVVLNGTPLVVARNPMLFTGNLRCDAVSGWTEIVLVIWEYKHWLVLHTHLWVKY